MDCFSFVQSCSYNGESNPLPPPAYLHQSNHYTEKRRSVANLQQSCSVPCPDRRPRAADKIERRYLMCLWYSYGSQRLLRDRPITLTWILPPAWSVPSVETFECQGSCEAYLETKCNRSTATTKNDWVNDLGWAGRNKR